MKFATIISFNLMDNFKKKLCNISIYLSIKFLINCSINTCYHSSPNAQIITSSSINEIFQFFLKIHYIS